MTKVTLQIMLDEKVVDTIQDREKPLVGEYLEIPKGVYAGLEVYVNRILNKYPKPGELNQETVVQCECVAV